MRKYLFTEAQVMHIIDKLYESPQEIYNLNGLAEILARTGTDQNAALSVLQDLYKEGGNQAIIKLFEDFTGIKLSEVGKGKYFIK